MADVELSSGSGGTRISSSLMWENDGSTRNMREVQEESSQRYGSGSRESFKLVVATQRRW